MVMQSRNHFEQTLAETARDAIAQSGLDITADGRKFVSELINHGVRNLGPSPRSGDISEAQYKLSYIIQQAAREARSSSDTINARVFTAVKKLLCPFPPFWKAPC